jgi:hypothetical protein
VLEVAEADRAIVASLDADESASEADALPFADSDHEAWERLRVELTMFGSERVEAAMLSFTKSAESVDNATQVTRCCRIERGSSVSVVHEYRTA